MYARSHSYTPLTTYTLFKGSFISKSQLLTNYVVNNTLNTSSLLQHEPNIPINVTDLENNGKKHYIITLFYTKTFVCRGCSRF